MALSIGNLKDDSFSQQQYFPTMIFSSICRDADRLNSYLKDLIFAERSKDRKGIVRSNFAGLGGWHSHNNLHNEAAYAPLVDRINQAGQRITNDLGYAENSQLSIGTMWAITNPPGSANKAHIHPNSHWSGVYYVQAPSKCGDIEFTDPRTMHIMQQPKFRVGKKRSRENWTKVQFTPTAGKMLIFPSWLYHGVNPNLTNEKGDAADRIIFSFNLSQKFQNS